MKVSMRLYMKYCYDAMIPLTVTEETVLGLVTRNGYFDPATYQARMKRTGIYLTEHQKFIMEQMPRMDEDPEASDARISMLREYVKKVRWLNHEIQFKNSYNRRHKI